MRKRRQFYEMKDLREKRLRAGLVLSEVARTAEMSLTRASIIEREPGLAHPGELEALERAIHLLEKERTDDVAAPGVKQWKPSLSLIEQS